MRRFAQVLLVVLPLAVIGQAVRNVAVLPNVAAMTNRLETLSGTLVEVLGQTNQSDWGSPKSYLLQIGATNAVDNDRVFPTALNNGRWIYQEGHALTDILSDTNDIIVTPSGTPANTTTLLRSWVLTEAFAITGVTYSSGTIMTNATVTWPDEMPGILTVTTYNGTWDAVDGFTITYGGVTVTQPAVLRDVVSGAVTNRPALLFSQ